MDKHFRNTTPLFSEETSRSADICTPAAIPSGRLADNVCGFVEWRADRDDGSYDCADWKTQEDGTHFRGLGCVGVSGLFFDDRACEAAAHHADEYTV